MARKLIPHPSNGHTCSPSGLGGRDLDLKSLKLVQKPNGYFVASSLLPLYPTVGLGGLLIWMLAGKRLLVVGVANARSIAWNVAQKWSDEGASVFVSYQNERMAPTVTSLIRENWARDLDPLPCAPCDVADEGQIQSLFATMEEQRFASADPNSSLKLDGMLHSVAYAPPEAMKDIPGTHFIEGTTKEAFITSHVVSAYSLIAMTRGALPYLSSNASVVALTYMGSSKVVPNYNVMGPAKASLEGCARALAMDLGSREGNMRVNCLSPGPLRTLAAKGIRGFTDMHRMAGEKSLLQRNATMAEVAATASFLVSDHSSGITGQVMHVDCGFSSTSP